MEDQNRLLAYQAIDENTKDSTVAKICKWVFEMEINGADTIRPSDQYFMDKFGWTNGTTRVAISEAKKSGFITTVGRGTSRTFELNVQFLKGKMGEIVAKKPLRKTLNLEDLSVLPNNLPNNLPNKLPNKLPNNLPNKMGQNNRGENASNSNSKSNSSSHLAYASMTPPPFSPCSQDGEAVVDLKAVKKADKTAVDGKTVYALLEASGKKGAVTASLIRLVRIQANKFGLDTLFEVAKKSRFDKFYAEMGLQTLLAEKNIENILNQDNKTENILDLPKDDPRRVEYMKSHPELW